jgi:hypothetical protein
MMARHRRQPSEDPFAGLREQLRAEAERHQPGRDRIWARVEAGLAEPPAPSDDPVRLGERRWSGLRVAAAGLGTAAALVIAPIVVVQATGDDEDPPQHPIGQQSQRSSRSPAPSTEHESGSAGYGKTPLTTHSTTQAPRTTPPTSTVVPPANGPAPATDLLDASGRTDAASNDHWGQNTVTLDVHRRLTRLTVVIKVRRTQQVAYHHAYTNLANTDVKFSRQNTEDAIIYTFTLIDGRKVPQGTWQFAAQYTRGPDHDTSKDTFVVTAAETGKSGTTSGHF